MAAPLNPSELSPVKRALLEIRGLRARIEELEHTGREPLAVVGMALRFPGAKDLESFWRLLQEGRSAITEIPRGRWDIERYYDADPAAPGKMYVRDGGFLDRVDEFDAGFFGIHPREAVTMDPQQRLLLEVAWEALENAAQQPEAIAESETGVFLGMARNDYQQLLMADAEQIDAYTGTGSSSSIAAGRLSYLLGFKGPSMVVDTSCSSSLTAVHLACRSLRNRECRMALAGGVNLILTPQSTVALCKSRMLARDGRCKAFDESADGFVRAEGCGVVILKRLSDAVADGDHIHAVIRGTAVNQDGRSGGLTVPSGPAQEALIRTALADAGIDATDVSYVEAHGTGTALGDPIEVHALVSALGKNREADRPLFLGSVKTNIGHLEAAAGIAGLIKTILSIEYDRIPPHIHFRKLNPHIDLGHAPIRISGDGAPWPAASGSRVAGVSSFGFSGTNGHVIVEQAPPAAPAVRPAEGPYTLLLSARSPEALVELVRRYTAWFESYPDLSPADVCFTAAHGRKHFEHRAAWTGYTLEEFRQKLGAFIEGRSFEPWPEEALVRPGRRIPLPTYPFERSRYWLEENQAGTWHVAVQAARAQSTRMSPGLDLGSYEIKWKTLRALTTVSILDALRDLGVPLVAGERYTSASLAEGCAILPVYTQLVERWLQYLSTQGYCIAEPDGSFIGSEASPVLTREGVLAETAGQFDDEPAILEYVARCGRQLAEILRGKQSPLETLFPNGDFSLAERLYESSPVSLYFGSLVATAANAVSRSHSGRCRILEVGAGTGATSASVLPQLQANRTEYWFSDVSNLFLNRARTKFAAYSFVRYGLLDLEQEPAAQGFERGGFDLVLATNVLHATADLPRTLAHLRSLLAPEGLLVVCEATEYLPWFDITTALIEGWQRYDDGIRREHPLLTSKQWKGVLRDAGFLDVQAFPQEGAPAEILGQHVLMALAPNEAAGIIKDPQARNDQAAEEFLERLHQALRPERRMLLQVFVRERLAAVLGVDSPTTLSPTQALMDLGLDSLMALELREVLERGLNLKGRLSSTLVFDFPTIDAVAAYLEREVFGTESEPTVREPLQTRSPAKEPIAIIGAGCRLPGGADDLDAFWTLLKNGADAITEVPRSRWNIADWYDPNPDTPGKMATRWGGFLNGVDQFDPEFFGIAPREAESMDPQQRLLLEVSWEALENAAQHPGRLGESRTGVFVGLTSDDYGRLLSRDPDLASLDTYYASGVARSVAAGRISYVLGLQGPNVSIDTACSSSLVAVHQACQSLNAGECRMALAGGANVILLPDTTVALSRAHMMAADGRCKTFDDRADGFVRSEGCVILVLKRLSDALEDHDRILAVIRGSAMNQDGRTSGLTVPNGPAQEAVIRHALAAADVRPADVDYVETHGTGTSLGDPIEVHALAAALGDGRGEESPLRLGSVKTNLGHLESAAGAAGLLKAALALSHGEIPPSLHFRRWNRNIDLKGVPVTVPVERTLWKRQDRPRIAGVSSFGFSGTNVHVVLEGPPTEAPAQLEAGEQLLKLSARSATALRRLAERYCSFFDRHSDVSLADVCQTASACRVSFPWHLEVRAESVAEMRRKLAEAAERSEFTQGAAQCSGEEHAVRQKVALPLTPFERQRYWRPGSRKPSGVHPLLGKLLISPAISQKVFEISARDWPEFLFEHRVRGKAVLPMAAYLEIFLAAADTTAVEDVLLREPLDLESAGVVQIVVGAELVELYRHNGDDWNLHASARLAKPGQRPTAEMLAKLQSEAGAEIDPRQQYELLLANGVELGPSFQLIRELRGGEGRALASVAVPPESGGYRAHPALVDAWIQVMSAALGNAGELFLPLGIERFELFEQPADNVWVAATVGPRNGETLTADIRVFDARGSAVARFEGLRLRRMISRHTKNCLYEPAWRKKDLVTAPKGDLAGSWLIFADASGVGTAVAKELEADGAVATVVHPGMRFRDLLNEPNLRGVIYLWALDAPGSNGANLEICMPVLELVQALAGRGEGARQVFLVTRGAQAVANEMVVPAQAPLWGLGRTIGIEHPEFRCVSVDLDPLSADAAGDLLQEIRQPDGERQVAWRDHERMGARLVPAKGDCARLEISTRGSLEGLNLQPSARRRPATGEVEIRVAAAGLNFRDVLNALDLYPGDAGPLGAECAGYVVEVGEGVKEFAAGDPVVAIARGSLGSYVTTGTALVARKPTRLSMEEAATIPVAYVTARYALRHLGRIRPGERVLIHAAAGGVGLAAIAEAQRAGAEVFATAGSEEKRAYLKSLGVSYVMNSRTHDYVDEILLQTAGRGVDVVLNSLGGEFVAGNLQVLVAGGRYLEIGKNGIWEASRVAKERPDVRYHLIDWGEEYERAPETVTAIFQQLIRDADACQIQPMPYQRFTLADAANAFRWMAQARHIGKIVVTPLPLRTDACYLITGGLGGLGLQVAEWLVERGARELGLAGRSEPGQEARAAIRRMESQGARVTVYLADVSRAGDLETVFENITRNGVPIKGIVHAAGILENAVLLQQDQEKFSCVLAPKIKGAWRLHELTAGLDLDFFVMFSSLASLLGSPGQANHAAANSFLDALAHYRRARGLPAVSINWGPWSDVGAASGERASSHLSGRGVGFLDPEQGLDIFELALTTGRTQFAAALVDWREAQKALRLDPRYLSEIAGTPAEFSPRIGATAELAGLLARTEAGGIQIVLLEEVRRRVCTVLGLQAAHPIDPERPLSDLGMDSLMAIELRNALSSALGKPLPSTLIFSYPSTGAIAEYLANEMQDDSGGMNAVEITTPDVDDFLSRIEQMSEGEVDRLLNAATEGIR